MVKSRKLFLTDYCLTPMEKIPGSGILCERGRVIGIGGASAFSLFEDGLEIHNLPGCYALPGFIDSHIHGIGPFDATHPDAAGETLRNMGRVLVRHGITTFVPTILSRPRDEMLSAIAAQTEMIEKGGDGADAAGIHIEGPFISLEKRGSQDAENIIEKIDLGLAKEMFQAGCGRIKIVTFAPELEHADKLVELMLEYGVIPSMGHSLANEEQTLRCIDAGARRCTYVFNGMPQLHHRESSLTTVALADDRVAVEMICDGKHIHPRFVKLTARCKPTDKIIGISNGVSTPLPSPTSEPVKNQNGVIQGATVTLENSWQHLMSYADMEQSHAASCFTSNPAQDLGLITRGELQPGRRADIVFLDSRTNQVKMTVVRGEIVYQAE